MVADALLDMKIAIADDHNLIVNGFMELLAVEMPQASVYTARNKRELLDLLAREPIDILFQDIRFGRYDATEFMQAIRDDFPSMKIVAISAYSERDVVNALVEQGVNGYISKADAGNEILAAIEAVQDGKDYFPPDFLAGGSAWPTEARPVELTGREKEVLDAIIEGKTIRETADELFLSAKTIESYRAALFAKFEVTNVASLVRKAILAGYH